MLAGVPAIRQLALFSALSLIAGFIWAVAVLPHCPGMDRPREFSPASELGEKEGDVRPGWAVGLGLALAAGIGLAAVRLPFDFSLRSLNLASPALLADQEAVARVWGGDQDRRIFMAPGRTPAEALALAGEVAADLGGRGGTGLSSLAGLCPPPAVQAENLRGWSEFTAALGEDFRVEFLKAAASAGFAPSAFEPFLNWLQATPEAVDPVRLAGLGWGFLVDYYLAVRNGWYYALVEMDAPGPPLTPAFSGRVFPLSARDLEEALSRALADSSRLLPAAAALACLALLLAVFKNKAEALAAFLPALAGLAAVLALSLLRGRALGLVEAAALPLIVGLGADYGLVAVSEARRKGSLGAGRAILVSGLSTIAGVGLLALARHPVLRTLGETVSVGLLAAMPAAILGLPRLYGAKR
jgi:predicted exporter